MNSNRFKIHVFTFSFIVFGFIATAQIKMGNNHEDLSPFAVLELESTDKGLLIPRMTTEQRDAAFTQQTEAGMIIYNTDTSMLQVFRESEDGLGTREWVDIA